MNDDTQAEKSLTPAQFAINHGNRWPYDAPDEWNGREPAPAVVDWAHSAVRGILANLSDRRSIRNSLEDVDHEIRIEIVSVLADIIREADRQRSAS